MMTEISEQMLSEGAERRRARSLPILVVDDEPDLEVLIRQRFRKKIRQSEYEFFFARNGEEALRVLDEHPEIPIVLTDLNMPEMDGLTLLAHLHERNNLLKAIVVSAYNDLENIRVAMNRGAFDFITKPIDFDDLEITINKTCSEVDALRRSVEEHDTLVSLNHELTAASRLQQSILPQRFPPFPDVNAFDIYARMLPAKHVGGDFYDFFLTEQGKLGFVIGDVSGKGMPAAIYMAVARTLIKAWGLADTPPGECLSRVNRILCEEGERHMFVTVFYGTLDFETGKLEYCSGGHNLPFRLKPGAAPIELERTEGLVLGIEPEAPFGVAEVTLEPNEGVFLYTDGVTEAMDGNQRFYGDDRLVESLSEVSGKPVTEVVDAVYQHVRSFCHGQAQYDDITALAVRYLRGS